MTTQTLSPVTTAHVRWCKSKCQGTNCDDGSYGTYQKRVYALAVAVALNGASVCHCGATITLWDGEVDRTVAGCYRPGYVVMTCHDCNNDRTHVAFNSELFANDVFEASKGIAIVGQTEAKKMWNAEREIGRTIKKSRYAL